MRLAAPLGLLVTACYSPAPPAGAPCPDGVCPSGLVCSPATQTCEQTAIDVDAAPSDAPFADVLPDTPDPPPGFRRRLSIANVASTTLPAGHAIRVPLDLASLISAGKLRPDLADLRVIGTGAIGEIDRIVDGPDGPAPAAVTFALAAPLDPGTSTSAYAIHYGGAVTSAPPADGTAVFALYDDFASAIGSGWLANDTPTVAAGQLVLGAGDTDALSTTAATDDIPIVSEVELVASVTNPNSDPTSHPDGTFYYWFGYQRTGDFTATDPWSVWIARDKNAIKAEQKSPVGCEAGCGGDDVAQNTAPHHYAIQRDPDETRFYRDGALISTIAVTNSTDYAIMLRNFAAASDVRIDWVRARARVSPDPTILILAEE